MPDHTSPIRSSRMSRPKQAAPPGFRIPPKPKQRPISELSVRELRDRQAHNAKILNAPGASTSSYVQRVSAEQAAIQDRLVELEGLEAISAALKNTQIISQDSMNIDTPQELPLSRMQQAKQKALFRATLPESEQPRGTISLNEAIRLEQEAHMRDKERQQRVLEKKQRTGQPLPGEQLTRAEREARIWAFMNYKPTDSDLEDDDDDDDEDDEDEDPANWFEDEQDEGIKGQPIVHPDVEDLSDIIRVDSRKMSAGYGVLYDPREAD